MKRPFAASVWQEGEWYVSQCLEVDIASQGESEEEALSNLRKHWNCTSSRHRPRVRQGYARSRLRLGRLKPQPFREVKRRLQRTVDTAIVPKKSEVPIGTLRSILS
jgi:hypothetical protein